MTKGADSELPGWQPKETPSWLPLVSKKRYSQISAGSVSAHKGGGPKDPSVRRGGTRDPGVAAPLTAAGCRGNCWRTSPQFPISLLLWPVRLFFLPFVQLITASPRVLEEYFSRLSAHSSCLQQLHGTAATVGVPQVWIAHCTGIWQGITWNQLPTRVSGSTRLGDSSLSDSDLVLSLFRNTQVT